MKHRNGFTLIELLVVIAIIAILAAILFPVFAQARESARQTQCGSNIKQIGVGILMYSDDYDETLPDRRDYSSPTCQNQQYGWTVQTRNWKHQVSPYIKNTEIYRCPSNPLNQTADEQAGCQTTTEPRYMRSYFYYHAFFKSSATPCSSDWWAGKAYSLVNVDYPANTILMGEHKDVYPDYGPWIAYYPPGRWPGANQAMSNWASKHRDEKRSQFAFLDGHAKLLPLLNTCISSGTGPEGNNMWQYNRNNLSSLIISCPGGGTADIRWVDTFCYTLERAP